MAGRKTTVDRRGKNKKLYQVWSAMIQRCHNPNDKGYEYYGSIGIKVCTEWKNDSLSFVEWAKNNGYTEGLSIDRINGLGNYEPKNCRWTTRTIQARNTKLHKTNTTGYRGVSQCVGRFRARIHLGKKTKSLGVYGTPKEAAIAYNNYVISNGLEHNINKI